MFPNYILFNLFKTNESNNFLIGHTLCNNYDLHIINDQSLSMPYALYSCIFDCGQCFHILNENINISKINKMIQSMALVCVCHLNSFLRITFSCEFLVGVYPVIHSLRISSPELTCNPMSLNYLSLTLHTNSNR